MFIIEQFATFYNIIIQPNLAMQQDYTDVCPLLDQPSPGQNYTQPVAVNRNIELVTRNLPPEVSCCYQYYSFVNFIK